MTVHVYSRVKCTVTILILHTHTHTHTHTHYTISHSRCNDNTVQHVSTAASAAAQMYNSAVYLHAALRSHATQQLFLLIKDLQCFVAARPTTTMQSVMPNNVQSLLWQTVADSRLA